MGGAEVEASVVRIGREAFVVRATGELDAHGAPALESALDEAARRGARRVLVDLAGVPFVDSTAMRILLRAGRRFDALVLAAGDLQVLRVFQVTGLDRKLPVARSRTEALLLLGERRAA